MTAQPPGIPTFLAAVTAWAQAQEDIAGLVLVGSQARGTAKPDSDVDVMVLARDPGRYARDPAWAARFGRVERTAVEDYGRVTSLRVWYAGGPEVEFGLGGPDWAAAPLDLGTRRVLSDGYRVLFERGGLFAAAQADLARLAIRPERPGDAPGIDRLHRAAFGGEYEPRLVSRLRRAGQAVVSLVAVGGETVLGHILFSPVQAEAQPVECKGLGLAPLAVLPGRQGQGTGGLLVRAGLEDCRREGADYVVVLGSPPYYARFGFTRAADAGLGNTYGAHDEFMVQALHPGGLDGVSGVVRYRPEFDPEVQE